MPRDGRGSVRAGSALSARPPAQANPVRQGGVVIPGRHLDGAPQGQRLVGEMHAACRATPAQRAGVSVFAEDEGPRRVRHRRRDRPSSGARRRQDVAGPRRPQATGSCLARSRCSPALRRVGADHRSRSPPNRPVPPGAETRVVLDRRRLDREDRGEEDEDQEQRNHHREATPERGHDDRSEWAIEADGCVHAGETPNPSIVFRDFH